MESSGVMKMVGMVAVEAAAIIGGVYLYNRWNRDRVHAIESNPGNTQIDDDDEDDDYGIHSDVEETPERQHDEDGDKNRQMKLNTSGYHGSRVPDEEDGSSGNLDGAVSMATDEITEETSHNISVKEKISKKLGRSGGDTSTETDNGSHGNNRSVIVGKDTEASQNETPEESVSKRIEMCATKEAIIYAVEPIEERCMGTSYDCFTEIQTRNSNQQNSNYKVLKDDQKDDVIRSMDMLNTKDSKETYDEVDAENVHSNQIDVCYNQDEDNSDTENIISNQPLDVNDNQDAVSSDAENVHSNQSLDVCNSQEKETSNTENVCSNQSHDILNNQEKKEISYTEKILSNETDLPNVCDKLGQSLHNSNSTECEKEDDITMSTTPPNVESKVVVSSVLDSDVSVKECITKEENNLLQESVYLSEKSHPKTSNDNDMLVEKRNITEDDTCNSSSVTIATTSDTTEESHSFSSDSSPVESDKPIVKSQTYLEKAVILESERSMEESEKPMIETKISMVESEKPMVESEISDKTIIAPPRPFQNEEVDDTKDSDKVAGENDVDLFADTRTRCAHTDTTNSTKPSTDEEISNVSITEAQNSAAHITDDEDITTSITDTLNSTEFMSSEENCTVHITNEESSFKPMVEENSTEPITVKENITECMTDDGNVTKTITDDKHSTTHITEENSTEAVTVEGNSTEHITIIGENSTKYIMDEENVSKSVEDEENVTKSTTEPNGTKCPIDGESSTEYNTQEGNGTDEEHFTESITDKENSTEVFTDKENSTEVFTDKENSTEVFTDKENSTEVFTDKENSTELITNTQNYSTPITYEPNSTVHITDEEEENKPVNMKENNTVPNIDTPKTYREEHLEKLHITDASSDDNSNKDTDKRMPTFFRVKADGNSKKIPNKKLFSCEEHKNKEQTVMSSVNATVGITDQPTGIDSSIIASANEDISDFKSPVKPILEHSEESKPASDTNILKGKSIKSELTECDLSLPSEVKSTDNTVTQYEQSIPIGPQATETIVCEQNVPIEGELTKTVDTQHEQGIVESPHTDSPTSDKLKDVNSRQTPGSKLSQKAVEEALKVLTSHTTNTVNRQEDNAMVKTNKSPGPVSRTADTTTVISTHDRGHLALSSQSEPHKGHNTPAVKATQPLDVGHHGTTVQTLSDKRNQGAIPKRSNDINQGKGRNVPTTPGKDLNIPASNMKDLDVPTSNVKDAQGHLSPREMQYPASEAVAKQQHNMSHSPGNIRQQVKSANGRQGESNKSPGPQGEAERIRSGLQGEAARRSGPQGEAARRSGPQGEAERRSGPQGEPVRSPQCDALRNPGLHVHGEAVRNTGPQDHATKNIQCQANPSISAEAEDFAELFEAVSRRDKRASLDRMKYVDLRRMKDGFTLLHQAAKYDMAIIVTGLYVYGAFIEIAEMTAGKDAGRFRGLTARDIAEKCRHHDIVHQIDKFYECEYSLSPLHDAARSGNFQAIQKLCENRLNVSMVGNHGNTPLYMAACAGRLPAIQLLLKYGADARHVCDREKTVLHKAAEWGHFEVVSFFVSQCHFDVNVRSKDGITPLHLAAAYGNTDTVRFLLDHKALISVQSNYHETPLFWAVAHGNIDTVQLLVQRGARTELQPQSASSQSDWNFLHVAAASGHADMCTYLIDRGYDIDDVTHKAMSMNGPYAKGVNALHLAAGHGRRSVIKFLIESGADVDAKDSEGSTPLHYAAQFGYTTAVQELIKHKANINKQNQHLFTPLHKAAANGHPEVVEILLNNGASLEMLLSPQYGGCSPLHLSAADGNYDVVLMLVKRGAPTNIQDANRQVPLHLAAKNGHLDVVRLLCSSGAAISCKDQKGDSPLTLALKKKHWEVAKFLKESGALGRTPIRHKFTMFRMGSPRS